MVFSKVLRFVLVYIQYSDVIFAVKRVLSVVKRTLAAVSKNEYIMMRSYILCKSDLPSAGVEDSV